VPYLAESIVPNSTFTEWTITVRKGVTFHDDTPCDGAALAFCMEQFKLSGLTNFALTYWKAKNSVKQTGPNSCTIYMTDPWVAFPAWLAGYIGGQVAYMFSPTQYRKGEAVLNTHPPSAASSRTSTRGPSSRYRTWPPAMTRSNPARSS
jgi:peptide/nickel transport system substrate-binding protein